MNRILKDVPLSTRTPENKETLLMKERLQILVRAAQDLSLARDLNSIMEIVRIAARKLTGADGATFVLKEDNKCYYADEDAISPLWKGSRFPLDSCISGWTMKNRQAAVIRDIFEDDRIPHSVYRATFVKSLAMVPIRTVKPIGAIGNYWAHPHQATQDEVMLLQSLADLTSVAMENVQVWCELEDRVKLRTQQLEESNRELQSFSSFVSHDLRAPLRGVYQSLQMLFEEHQDEFDKDTREFTEDILQSISGMQQLVDGLLEFSRMGRKELVKEKVDVNKMVRDVVKELKEQNNGREIDFNISVLPDLLADPRLLRQVWVNLLSNAVKYSSGRDRSVIDVSFGRENGELVFIVKDNGAGFDMKNYDKLFSVFQRLHTQSEFEGTGIGLALVERIINKHGGRIWAVSQPDKGAEFSFSFPND